MITIKAPPEMLVAELMSYQQQGCIIEIHGFGVYIMTDDVNIANKINGNYSPSNKPIVTIKK